MKILVVCLGNICRSPLAEAILQKKVEAAGLLWKIDSAGTNGFHVGEPPHHLSQKVGKKNGLDLSCQVARKFEAKDLDNFDIIFAMAGDVMTDMKKIAGSKTMEPHVRLFLEDLYPGENRNVPDPWYGDENGYHEVYDLIDKASDAIIKKYLVSKPKQA